MFLRWHSFVDVVAGVLLAVLARQAGKFVSERETARGADGDDRQPVWEPIFPSKKSNAPAE